MNSLIADLLMGLIVFIALKASLLLVWQVELSGCYGICKTSRFSNALNIWMVIRGLPSYLTLYPMPGRKDDFGRADTQYLKYNDVYYFMTFAFTRKLKTSEKGLPSFRK